MTSIFSRLNSFLGIATLFMLSASCSNNDSSDEPKNPANSLQVTINTDGKTSNGAKYAPASDGSFYLDYIMYQIVDSHIEVVGADKIEINDNVKVYSPITYMGIVYNVRKIEKESFRDCKKIVEITLPDGITEIGDRAFEGCSNLTRINLPQTLEYISPMCFYECFSLSSINIPNEISHIGGFAFYNCKSLRNLTIPASCKTIYSEAFNGCNFQNVNIENGVEYIYYQAFAYSIIQNLSLPQSLIYYFDGYNLEMGTIFVFFESQITNANVYLSHWDKYQLGNFFYSSKIPNFNLY